MVALGVDVVSDQKAGENGKLANHIHSQSTRRGNPNFYKGMPSPQPLPKGRQKGVPNRLTMEAKEIIAKATEKMGGWQGLVAWAQSNPQREDLFWTRIFPRIVPVQLNGDLRQTITAIRQIIISPEGEENIVPPIFGDGGSQEVEDAEFKTIEHEEKEG